MFVSFKKKLLTISVRVGLKNHEMTRSPICDFSQNLILHAKNVLLHAKNVPMNICEKMRFMQTFEVHVGKHGICPYNRILQIEFRQKGLSPRQRRHNLLAYFPYE